MTKITKLLRFSYVIIFLVGIGYSGFVLSESPLLRTWPVFCLALIFVLVYSKLPKKIWPMVQLLITPLWPVLWHRDFKAIVASSIMCFIIMVFAYVIFIINDLRRDKTHLFWRILGHSSFLLMSLSTALWFLYYSLIPELNFWSIGYSLAFVGLITYNTILIYKNYFYDQA